MEFKEELKQYLLSTFPEARQASAGREVVMRCKFCGDSKVLSSKHLYIFCGDDTTPPMYHCFKCGESGVLTRDILSKLTGYDSGANSILYQLNNRIKEVSKNSKYKPRKNNIYNLSYNIPYMQSIYTEKKIEYINHRLGLQLPYEELINDKIVFDISTLLKYNRITETTRKKDFLEFASIYCIGFLTMDNAYITLRNLHKNPPKGVDFRYAIYNVFNSYDSHMRYYCIPSQIDTLSTEPVHIHIAEGSFDILSVFYHLCNANRMQNIYIAANGKSFSNVIKFILSSYAITNTIIHMYLDNDVRDDYVLPICKLSYEIGIPVYLHRNGFKNEKDYGVDGNHIIDTYVKYRK